MRGKHLGTLAALVVGLGLTAGAHGSFHEMQIEEVIGGVNGDPTAQAIQLRMRAAGQNFLSENQAKLIAYDAAGLNPVTIIDFTGKPDPITANLGSTVLITSLNFNAKTSPAAVSNYTMTNLIPAAYLPAGRLTWENGSLGILWSLAWGGSAYTGPTTGDPSHFNDADGDFGKMASALPSSGHQALLFSGLAGAPSTTNSSDYALTAGAATFTNNSASNFTVIPEPASGLLLVGGLLLATRRRR